MQKCFNGLILIDNHVVTNYRYPQKPIIVRFSYAPQVFTKDMITKLFAVYKRASQGEKSLILLIIKFISEKKPAMLAEFLSQLCDDKMFKPDSMNLRSGIIACIGSINAVCIVICKVRQWFSYL